MIQKEIGHPNRPLRSKEIELVPTKKSLVPDSFTSEFYQSFRKELLPLQLQLFRNKKRREQFLTHSMWPVLPWYQNQRHSKKIKLEPNIPSE